LKIVHRVGFQWEKCRIKRGFLSSLKTEN
jgi:hypothetical protein